MGVVVEGLVQQQGFGLTIDVAAAAPGTLSFETSKRYTALVDTGSTFLIVTKGVALELSLPATGNIVRTMTANGPIDGPTYLIDIGFAVLPQWGTYYQPYHKIFEKCLQ